MANERNLIPFGDRTESEQRRIRSAGGIASGVARRRKRSLREAADLFLSLPVADVDVYNHTAMQGVDPEDIDHQMAIIAALGIKAARGDEKAARVLFGLLGEDAAERETPPETFSMDEKEALLREIAETFGAGGDG